MKTFIKLLIIVLFGTSILEASVGKITAMSGNASLERGKNSFAAALGSSLEAKDSIVTAKDAKVQLTFNDNTIITVGKQSRFSVEEYLFDATSSSTAKFNMVSGTIRAMSGKIGKIAPEKFAVKTKTATIGIRGTDFVVNVSPDGKCSVLCLLGSITFQTNGSNGIIVVPAGSFITMSAAGVISEVREFKASDLSTILQEGFTVTTIAAGEKSVQLDANTLAEIAFEASLPSVPVLNPDESLDRGGAVNVESLATETANIITTNSIVVPVVVDSPVVTAPVVVDSPVVTAPVVVDSPVVTAPVVVDSPVVTAPVVVDSPVVTAPVVTVPVSDTVAFNGYTSVLYHQAIFAETSPGIFDPLGDQVFAGRGSVAFSSTPSTSSVVGSMTVKDTLGNPLGTISLGTTGSYSALDSFSASIASYAWDPSFTNYTADPIPAYAVASFATATDVTGDFFSWGEWSIDPMIYSTTTGIGTEQYLAHGYWAAGSETPTAVIDAFRTANAAMNYTGTLIGEVQTVDANGYHVSTSPIASGSVSTAVNFGANTFVSNLAFQTADATNRTLIYGGSIGTNRLVGNLTGGSLTGATGSFQGGFYGTTGKIAGGTYDAASATDLLKIQGAFKAVAP